MSEQEQTEFLSSLELARRALYARDPKRRAMEAMERQLREVERQTTCAFPGTDRD